MNNKKAVYIFNMSEDVWPFISSISDAAKRQFEIDENLQLADRELFTNINEKEFIFISPLKFNEDFIAYFKKISGINNIEVLVPSTNSGLICDDIVKDKNLISRLIELGKKDTLIIKSYSSSDNFYALLNHLKKNHVKISAPESPEEINSWTVNYFGSKTGIRQLVNKMNDKTIQMAEGVITSGIENAAQIAALWYLNNKGVVIKTHKGHAGAGVLLFKYGLLPNEYNSCKEKILEIFKQDQYWTLFPIIIETYLDVDERVSGGFPNVEFRISENGTVQVLYPCGMRIKNGVFQGVESHESIYSKDLESKMIKIGSTIGKEYAKHGYRGNFEIDYALGKNGKLYITESNVRKTGGTFVYETAIKLIGKNFLKDSYILSTNVYKIPGNKKYTFELFKKKLTSLLYSSETKEGIVLSSANLLKHGSFGYIIFGNTKKRATDIEKKMIGILQV